MDSAVCSHHPFDSSNRLISRQRGDLPNYADWVTPKMGHGLPHCHTPPQLLNEAILNNQQTNNQQIN
jgi:hypothetical protein